jgi:hypothetical protein
LYPCRHTCWVRCEGGREGGREVGRSVGRSVETRPIDEMQGGQTPREGRKAERREGGREGGREGLPVGQPPPNQARWLGKISSP